MKNNKILRYGGIAALILIALYAFTSVSYTHLTLPTILLG